MLHLCTTYTNLWSMLSSHMKLRDQDLGQCIIIYKIRREKKNREVVKLVETKTRKAQQMRNLMNEKELRKYWGKIMPSFKNSAKSTSY